MSASTSRKSLETSRFARARNSGIGLDGSVRLKNSATASSARIASCRDLTTPRAAAPARACATGRPRRRMPSPSPSGCDASCARSTWPIRASCADQRSKSGVASEPAARASSRRSCAATATAPTTLSCSCASSASGIDPNAALTWFSSTCASPSPGGSWCVAMSMSRRLNVPCCRLLTSGTRRSPSTTAIGSAKQFSAFRRRIASSSTSGYVCAPVRLQPLRRDVQRLGKCRHSIGSQQRRPQGARATADPCSSPAPRGPCRESRPTPGDSGGFGIRFSFGLRRGVERPRLAEQPERVERRQQLRIFEVLSAGLLRRDRLEQLLALPSGTHHADLCRTRRPAPEQPPASCIDTSSRRIIGLIEGASPTGHEPRWRTEPHSTDFRRKSKAESERVTA